MRCTSFRVSFTKRARRGCGMSRSSNSSGQSQPCGAAHRTIESRIEQGRSQSESLRASRGQWESQPPGPWQPSKRAQRLDAARADMPGKETEFRSCQTGQRCRGPVGNRADLARRGDPLRTFRKLLTRRRTAAPDCSMSAVRLPTPTVRHWPRWGNSKHGRRSAPSRRGSCAWAGAPRPRGGARPPPRSRTQRGHWRRQARLNARATQSRVANSQRLGEWLTRHGMDALTRLWQRIDIEEGWRRQRVGAAREAERGRRGRPRTGRDLVLDRPPESFTIFGTAGGTPTVPMAAPDRGLPRLIDLRCEDLAQSLLEWLAPVTLRTGTKHLRPSTASSRVS
jgi:hypothetical protein